MELKHLRYFLALADELNFSRAAARLHISQPPLTRQIQQLEQTLKVHLFKRTPRGVTLTEAGVTFLEEARKLQFLADQAVIRTQMTSRGELGRIEIGVFGSAILSVIPQLMLEFGKIHPKVTFGLHTMHKSEQIEALLQRRLSIGFSRIFPEVSDMTIETVFEEGFCVALNEIHPLAARKTILVGDLEGQPLVIYPNIGRPSFADNVIALCRHAGFNPVIAFEAEDVLTSIALVSSGLGLCVVPQSAAGLMLPRTTYRPLIAPDARVELKCMYRSDDTSPSLQAFLNHVRRIANNPLPGG
ncbi:Aromatic hydrocarbon utilization transcriptional regulator CatR (LysR family) [Georgfuchsia toluolica]|uniref:Aromatic hydrocarbon utilization transcriptional regulator CatR (LysR family) n=1 Tax=Georgfuchsia toluolica TaxID=424218 RepID=A0A916J935_9PROT|nr:LysR family transcriptional regulator [Georgfuchsia toluolica]CAG4885422.1 Aromatic hydrocarbon utilization transcriptional regulator CatR (LysR family) [Georgfuchsia toluolica]CAG4885434.1 Aromatic hydrocarbon utilization transcriptional regulator CatR (LysR family) [Georgfuchsia toluolica]